MMRRPSLASHAEIPACRVMSLGKRIGRANGERRGLSVHGFGTCPHFSLMKARVEAVMKPRTSPASRRPAVSRSAARLFSVAAK